MLSKKLEELIRENFRFCFDFIDKIENDRKNKYLYKKFLEHESFLDYCACMNYDYNYNNTSNFYDCCMKLLDIAPHRFNRRDVWFAIEERMITELEKLRIIKNSFNRFLKFNDLLLKYIGFVTLLTTTIYKNGDTTTYKF